MRQQSRGKKTVPWPDCWNAESRIHIHSDHGRGGIKRPSKHVWISETHDIFKLVLQTATEHITVSHSRIVQDLVFFRNNTFTWTLCLVRVYMFSYVWLSMQLSVDRAQVTIVQFLCMHGAMAIWSWITLPSLSFNLVFEQHNEDFFDFWWERETERRDPFCW